MKRTTPARLIAAYRTLQANPDTEYDIGVWPPEVWKFQDFRQWFRRCLNRKINRQINRQDTRTGRCHTEQYQVDLAHDCRIIRGYYQRRIRQSGSTGVLRTLEMKRRYPHVDNQPWGDC